jgi:hypothetical protein
MAGPPFTHNSTGTGRIKVYRENGLKRILNAKRVLQDGAFDACTVGGRILIVLTALLIGVTPWTEYYWHFDNFLRGGQDFEFGLLSTMMVLCLLLVLMQHNKQGMAFLFALRQWLPVLLQHHEPASPKFSSLPVIAFHAVPLPDLVPGPNNLPLRI